MNTYTVQFLSRRAQKWQGTKYLPGQPLEIDPTNQTHLAFIRNPDTVEIKFVKSDLESAEVEVFVSEDTEEVEVVVTESEKAPRFADTARWKGKK